MEIENKDCLLTIAIPTYNRRNLLKRALDSIVPQMNSKIEVLVSDNASNDGTDEMIATNFPMFRYIKNERNMGGDYNFLQCYREAKGKYVILLGSDDRFADGALAYIVDFLEKYNCDLTFVNFRFYDVTKKEIYIKGGEWIKNYNDKRDIVTTDRNKFIEYAGHGITFMSASIAKKALVAEVINPERYIGMYFIHTNMMLESVKKPDAIFGVIMRPFIEANATSGDSEMSKIPEKHFMVFGKYMYYTLCSLAIDCGFSEEQMRGVYLQYMHDCPFWKAILSVRGQKSKAAMESFWKDGNPIVKHYPLEWFKAMIATFIPQFIVDWLYKIYKSLK